MKSVTCLTMRASKECIAALKQFEGLSLKAYRCSAGRLTIGYGHASGVKAGARITQAQAEAYLQQDIADCEKSVQALLPNLTQGQFDALVEWTFQFGCSRLRTTTLYAKIKANAGAAAVCAQFRRWVYVNGKVATGLQKRREWDCARWQRG